MYKGTILENSLENKTILNKIKIIKTWQDGDWILHNVLVEEGQMQELVKFISDGPWYMHFWIPGKDQIKVVYKNKIFDIKSSDKSTWRESVEYGKSIGVPEEQLDFITN